VKAKLRTLPLATYFPMIQRYEASIYMLGWGVPTFDCAVQHTVAGAHRGRREVTAITTWAGTATRKWMHLVERTRNQKPT
jgi:hypothetical protein